MKRTTSRARRTSPRTGYNTYAQIEALEAEAMHAWEQEQEQPAPDAPPAPIVSRHPILDALTARYGDNDGMPLLMDVDAALAAQRANAAARGREALQHIALRALRFVSYTDDIDGRVALLADAYAVGWEAAVARMASPLSEIDAQDMGADHATHALECAGVRTDSRSWFVSLFSFRFMLGYTDCCK